MVRELIHDPILLSRKSTPADREDLQTVQDLLDTIQYHSETCVGMAANMIGVTKRIIVFVENGTYQVMLNPEIVKQSNLFYSEESCLSLLGGPRPTTRYQKIKVRYQNTEMQTRLKTYEDWTAQIIQHEIDHCNGVLV